MKAIFIIRSLESNKDAIITTINSVKQWGEYLVYKVVDSNFNDFFNYNKMLTEVKVAYKEFLPNMLVIFVDAGMILENGNALLTINKPVCYATENRSMHLISRVLICKPNDIMIIIGTLKPKIKPNMKTEIMQDLVFTWKDTSDLMKLITYEKKYLTSLVLKIKSLTPPKSSLNAHSKEFTPAYANFNEFHSNYNEVPTFFYTSLPSYPLSVSYSRNIPQQLFKSSSTPSSPNMVSKIPPKLNKSDNSIPAPRTPRAPDMMLKHRCLYGVGSYDLYHYIMINMLTRDSDSESMIRTSQLIFDNSTCKRYKILASCIKSALGNKYSMDEVNMFMALETSFGELENSEYYLHLYILCQKNNKTDDASKFLLKAHKYLYDKSTPYLFRRCDIAGHILTQLINMKLLTKSIYEDVLLNTKSPYRKFSSLLQVVIGDYVKKISPVWSKCLPIINAKYFCTINETNIILSDKVIALSANYQILQEIDTEIKNNNTFYSTNVCVNIAKTNFNKMKALITILDNSKITALNTAMSTVWPFDNKIILENYSFNDFIIVASCKNVIMMQHKVNNYYRIIKFDGNKRILGVGTPFMVDSNIIGIIHDITHSQYIIAGKIDDNLILYGYKTDDLLC